MKLPFYLVVFLCFCVSSITSAQNRSVSHHSISYYIDSEKGDDLNSGTNKNSAWRSFHPLSHIHLHPGDAVRFKRGSSFTGPFVINDSGTPANYIIISDYGSASDPAPSFTNPVFKEDNYGNCIRVKGSYVVVENLYCHSTAAYQPIEYNGSGWVVWEMGAIHIDSSAEHCIVRNNEIKDCVAGIRSNGQHAIIEHNYIHDCNRVLKEWTWGPLGIWLGADWQEVRYNRVFNYSAVDPRIGWGPDSYGSGADGGAFEIDDARFEKSHIAIHHNYTKDCQGFLEVTWTDVKQNPAYKNFQIHHNVSDDYQQFVAMWRGENCYIENNTIIRRKVNANDWGVFNITQRNSKNYVRNNIVVTEKDVMIFNVGRKGTAKPNTIISNNLYFAADGKMNIGKEGPGDSAVFADPLFKNYKNATSAADFTIIKGSAAIDKGLLLSYETDFLNNRIKDGKPDLGAFEFQQTIDKKAAVKKLPVDYVDPFIGTANQKQGVVNWKNGETFPGAVVPWGMVSVSPHNVPGSKSGYRKDAPYLYGFGNVHLSGVGCSDLGNVVLMPGAGTIRVEPEKYKSLFGDEEAGAGFYKTVLRPSGIVSEITATTHTSISKFDFTTSDSNAFVLLDASVTLNEHFMPAPGYVKLISKNKVVGWTESGHFCGAPDQTQRVYFFAQFSEPADSAGTWIDKNISGGNEQSGKGVGAFFSFKNARNKIIYVKVGVSYVSIANAELNLRTEQPGWDFQAVKKRARETWNKYLSRIEVKGGTESEKTIFYSALYHMLLHPSVFSDVNGEYLAMGHTRIKKTKPGSDFYHVFSLWDTWRNLHVFLSLFYPERQRDMVASLLDMYKENGWLPKWELAGNDAHVMVGDPGGNVLLETYANGMHDIDLNLAFKAMAHNATDTINNPIRPGLQQYLSLHYVPANVKGSVSMSLEYCMADHSVSQMAKLLGRKKDYELFYNRSQYYKNLYDSSTGFFRPKNADGTWYEPFKPNEFKGTGFIEGSAWNYLFFVPFDQKKLKELFGGERNYISRLQQTFDTGQFVLYNEPDIAYPYLFHNVKKEAWRTQQEVHKAIEKNFNTGTGGLPGNDDCGTLSAWYVFSALGFYPDLPASGNFAYGTPVFSTVIFHLNNHYYKGKTFTIHYNKLSAKNIYLGSVKLNGSNHDNLMITHSDIENGGDMHVEMRDKHGY
jgi:predicted alpha-1,2-mannosidase